ncbi:MAG: hypothetical protein ACE5G1_08610, partial [bacterium]
SPKVCSSNAVRLTPFLKQTINHLIHSYEEKEYSVIGGGYFASTDDGDAIRRAGSQLLEKAESVFPRMNQAQLTRLYFGTKTEIISSRAKRNYLYKIEEIEDDVFAVVPGKFSLAFSLAVNTFKQVMGDCPRTYTSYYPDLEVARFIALTKHKLIVKEFLASEFTDEPPAKITVVDEETELAN